MTIQSGNAISVLGSLGSTSWLGLSCCCFCFFVVNNNNGNSQSDRNIKFGPVPSSKLREVVRPCLNSLNSCFSWFRWLPLFSFPSTLAPRNVYRSLLRPTNLPTVANQRANGWPWRPMVHTDALSWAHAYRCSQRPAVPPTEDHVHLWMLIESHHVPWMFMLDHRHPCRPMH